MDAAANDAAFAAQRNFAHPNEQGQRGIGDNGGPALKPDDYASPEAFLADVRKQFFDDILADQFNMLAAIDDAKFVAGDQWDYTALARRTLARKPTLTVNRLPAFIAQVQGNRLMNETSIKIVADAGGTKEEADIREGWVRATEKNSNADRAYDNAMQNCVIGGLGNFRLSLEYSTSDVFEQDAVISPIPNPQAVVWDRMRHDPTGRDAGHVFVVDTMPVDLFRKRWPNARPSEFGLETTFGADLRINGWFTVDTVRVVTYQRMRMRKKFLILTTEGQVEDVTGQPKESFINRVQVGKWGPIMREADCPYMEQWLMTGADLLEGPYQLDVDRVMVFRVPGWEINVGETWHRFGLVRFAKDPQRLHNFWRSIIAEKLMQTPKAKWIAGATAVAGREDKWRNSHLTDDPLLVYNDDAANKPEQVQPAQMEAALIQEAGIAAQDIKDVTNLHEANLGLTSNEVSGKAINARARQGELGTVIYQHNLYMAQEECGKVLNQIFPMICDTARIIMILGPDGKAKLQKINYDNDKDSVPVTAGKYRVTATTGPSYATLRQEGAETMQALVNAYPQMMVAAGDLIVGNLDIPGSEMLEKRLKMAMPPQLQDPEDMTPEQKQQSAMQAQVAMQKQAAELATLHGQADEAEARAKKTGAETEEAQERVKKIQTETRLLESQINLNNANAELAMSKAGKTQQDVDLDEARHLHDTVSLLNTLENDEHGRALDTANHFEDVHDGEVQRTAQQQQLDQSQQGLDQSAEQAKADAAQPADGGDNG